MLILESGKMFSQVIKLHSFIFTMYSGWGSVKRRQCNAMGKKTLRNNFSQHKIIWEAFNMLNVTISPFTCTKVDSEIQHLGWRPVIF